MSFREQLTLHRVVQVIHEVAVHGRDPFLSDRFLFDKDGLEQYDFTLAAYSLGMMHHLLTGEFETAALRPHPAHKKVVAFYRFTNGLWALMTPVQGELASWPQEIFVQKANHSRRRIDNFHVRGVHQPLPVLPRVQLVEGWKQYGQCCMSCNVCQLCHDDAFKGRYRKGEGPVPGWHNPEDGIHFWCKCAQWECDGCKKKLRKHAFSVNRWRHRKERDRRTICLICEASTLVSVHPCTFCGNELPSEEYTPSMWHNRVQQAAVCLACQALPPKEEKHPCTVCGDELRSEKYTTSMWQHRAQRRAVCLACQALPSKQEEHPCSVCEVYLLAEHYSQSMWHHRRQRLAVCKACQALEAELQGPQCPACLQCNKAMPQGSRSRFRKGKRSTWTCEECRNGDA